MRIALFGDELLGWQGGRDFFRILFESLKQGCANKDDVTLTTCICRDSLPWRGMQIGKYLLSNFPYDYGWIAHEINRDSRNKLIERITGERPRIFISGRKESDGKCFEAFRGFDVAGPFISRPDWIDGDAWIGHLYDCQHKRLPHFFSQQEISARDDLFVKLLRTAPVVIVNSQDVKADLMTYFAPIRGKIIVLPFAAAADPKWFQLDPQQVQRKYRLPSRYFLCSNQFWQHKNHGVIFEALARARARGRTMAVAFTGEMHDYRNQRYVTDLMVRVQTLGVRDDCHFLGLIPKLEQIAIMRAALAVIQPTLFEGSRGGLAVADAIGIGQRVIVSDIPVNREIEQYVTEFFPATDPEALFNVMSRVSEKPYVRRLQEELVAEGVERRRHFGKVLWSAFAMATKGLRQSRQPVVSANLSSLY